MNELPHWVLNTFTVHESKFKPMADRVHHNYIEKYGGRDPIDPEWHIIHTAKLIMSKKEEQYD